MYCTKCGANLPDDMRFCIKCGAPVATTVAPSAQVAGEDSAQQAADQDVVAQEQGLQPEDAMPPQPEGEAQSQGEIEPQPGAQPQGAMPDQSEAQPQEAMPPRPQPEVQPQGEAQPQPEAELQADTVLQAQPQAELEPQSQPAQQPQGQAKGQSFKSPLVLGLAAVIVVLLVVVIGFATNWFGMAGQGGSSGGSQAANPFAGKTPEQVVEEAELKWNGYTMGIELATDSSEYITENKQNKPKGKLIKICFRYIDGGKKNGFAGKTLLDDIDEYPITVTVDGKDYEWNNAIGDITLNMKNNSLELAESQPHFSIEFDVPKGTELEDCTLSTGEGDGIPLTEYVSEEYAKRHEK